MARKHVVQYFLEVQNQYFEMLDNVKELDAAAKKGLVGQDRLDEATKDIDNLKANYERIAFIMMLLNKPNRKSKNKKEEYQNKQWYNYLKGASKEAILDENKDVLADLKKLIKEIKEEK